MTVQADVLHSTVVACLDDLDTLEGQIVAVGIVVAFQDDTEKEWYRAYSDRDTYFEQLGLFRAGLEVIQVYQGADNDSDDD